MLVVYIYVGDVGVVHKMIIVGIIAEVQVYMLSLTMIHMLGNIIPKT